MATYKFEQFNTEIIDPTIEVNRHNIVTNDLTKTISCDVVLITPNGSKFGVTLNDLPRNGQGWDDSDLEAMISVELQKYLVS